MAVEILAPSLAQPSLAKYLLEIFLLQKHIFLEHFRSKYLLQNLLQHISIHSPQLYEVQTLAPVLVVQE